MATLTKEQAKEMLQKILPPKQYEDWSRDTYDAARDACIDKIINNAIKYWYLDTKLEDNEST